MLSQATQAYTAELVALDPPQTQRAFWNYVIAQERAQAEAFRYASQQDYATARSVLVYFMENTLLPESLNR